MAGASFAGVAARYSVRYLRLALAALACSTPGFAQASDFSVLLYLLYGLCVLVALPLTLAAYFSARACQSRFARALIWGGWSALVLTPLSIEGGNGTLTGTPLLVFTSSIFGSDPAYAAPAIKVLLIALPVWTLALWQIQRMWAAAAADDKQPEDGA